MTNLVSDPQTSENFLHATRRGIVMVLTDRRIRTTARLRNSSAFMLATHALNCALKDPSARRLLFGRARGFNTSYRRATAFLFGESRAVHVLAVKRILEEGLQPRAVWEAVQTMGLVKFSRNGVVRVCDTDNADPQRSQTFLQAISDQPPSAI